MNKKSGNILIELLMILILLMLFSISTYELIEAGKKAQTKIIARKTAQVEARIALSFINVRLRQNDEEEKIEIKKYNNKNAIVIKERTEEFSYDTWIYYSDGKLFECITNMEELPVEMLSTEIASIDDFVVKYDESKNLISNNIYYSYLDTNKNKQVDDSFEQHIYLNSGLQ